jgi:uncharacterized protein
MTVELDFSSIPIVDHHAHSLRRQPPGNPSLWQGFFTEGREPGIVLDHVPNSLFYRYSVKALAGLLGCEASPEAVLAERDRMGPQAWAERMVRQANIASMLIDYGFRGPESYQHAELKDILPCRVEPILRLETLAQELALRYETIDQVLDAFSAEVEKAPSAGYVALKSIIAYRTGLVIREWPMDEVRAAFAPIKEQARREGQVRIAAQPVNDTLVLRALDIAARHELPVQFHTGFGDADLDLRLVNPLHFRPLLESSKYKRVPWVVLHMGYPYTRESAFLAHVYSNVFVDLSLGIPFALSDIEIALTQLMGLAPLSKLLYASDGFSIPELFWLGAKAGRTGLERVLGRQVSEGALTVDEAYELGGLILHGNAEKVYCL